LLACFECLERQNLELSHSFGIEEILSARSWTKKRLQRLVARCCRHGFLQAPDKQRFVLTKTGVVEAKRVARNHRLWETFLVTHADIATSQVDRHAHTVEDVLDAPLIQELESILARNRQTKPSTELGRKDECSSNL